MLTGELPQWHTAGTETFEADYAQQVRTQYAAVRELTGTRAAD